VVSVAITCFNSEKWLGRALDSVLVQETEFPVEIVIADDCSIDAKVAVAKSYQDKYPHIVRVWRDKRTLGHSGTITAHSKSAGASSSRGLTRMITGPIQRNWLSR